MEIKIELSNEDDLLSCNTVLLYGSFNIIENEINISLFKEKFCDIPTSLVSLSLLIISEHFQKGKELLWVALDNNEIGIRKLKNQFILSKKNIEICLSYFIFINELKSCIDDFRLKCLSYKNDQILNSSFYASILEAQELLRMLN